MDWSVAHYETKFLPEWHTIIPFVWKLENLCVFYLYVYIGFSASLTFDMWKMWLFAKVSTLSTIHRLSKFIFSFCISSLRLNKSFALTWLVLIWLRFVSLFQHQDIEMQHDGDELAVPRYVVVFTRTYCHLPSFSIFVFFGFSYMSK